MLIRYQGTENDGQISWSDQLVTLNDGIKCLCGRTIPFRLVEVPRLGSVTNGDL